jgi:hypothetical protein
MTRDDGRRGHVSLFSVSLCGGARANSVCVLSMRFTRKRYRASSFHSETLKQSLCFLFRVTVLCFLCDGKKNAREREKSALSSSPENKTRARAKHGGHSRYVISRVFERTKLVTFCFTISRARARLHTHTYI